MNFNVNQVINWMMGNVFRKISVKQTIYNLTNLIIIVNIAPIIPYLNFIY